MNTITKTKTKTKSKNTLKPAVQAKVQNKNPSKAIHYRITSNDLAAHLFHVTMTINASDRVNASDVPTVTNVDDAPDTADGTIHQGQILSLPVWIPGSYMVREFARNIVQIHAHCQDKKIALTKLDKATWQIAPEDCHGLITIVYEVYAWDLSVRAAHLDQTHGFFNGSSVFLQVHGQEELTHIVDIVRPEDNACRTWRIATSLPELKAKRYGFGTYHAENYDALLDHPVEMGDFSLATFDAHGVPHDMVFTGRVPHLDMQRIVADVKKICEAQITFFEPRTHRAPMDRYVFMTMVTDDGRGGLEHRASTALMFPRLELPTKNENAMSDAYADFLGLCSHEYFHTWNVKRIKPAAFVPYDLKQENYTSLLWVFEGFTSYYDDLFLRKTQLIDESKYLNQIANAYNAILRSSGRKKQSVAQSSFDAWTKFYRQDENAPNSIVSYYVKGSLIALGLDLLIRSETQGKKSLDDVMRYLWKTFGKDFYTLENKAKRTGLAEQEMPKIVALATGIAEVKANKFIAQYVYDTKELPLVKWFAEFGIELKPSAKVARASLGIKTTIAQNECQITHVFEGMAAHKAGLSAGDKLIAVNGFRIKPSKGACGIQLALQPYSIGETVQIHAFRRDELMLFEAKLQADDAPHFVISVQESSQALLLSKRPSK